MDCRVCGLTHDEPPWGEDGLSPTFDICECCGVEFGYEDSNSTSGINYLLEWVKSGAMWHDPQAKPHGWSLEKQLQNVYSKQDAQNFIVLLRPT